MVSDPFDALVTKVYGAATDLELWPVYLEKLRAVLGCEFVAVGSIHKPTLAITPLYQTPWDEAAMNELLTRQLARVPMRERIMQGALDTPASSLTMMAEREFMSSDFYRDWAGPNGLRDGAACTIAETAEHRILIGFATARSREPITVGELALLQRLSPHMRRAVAIEETLKRKDAETKLAMSALSQIDTPILVCDAAQALVFANQAGEAALGDNGPLTVSRGRVQPRSVARQAGFSEALRRAAIGGQALGQRGIGIPLAAPQSSTHAYILPLGAQEWWISQQPLVAVFLSTRKNRARTEEAMLSTLFDLTSAEAKVIVQIARAQGIPSAAEALGVSINTIKTHLTHIYQKTGCTSQGELVELIWELSLPVVR
jgi:DNA-binding CsgD family transcriptional regulator/PAS domain-containing protein